jgi:hypothetical protein
MSGAPPAMTPHLRVKTGSDKCGLRHALRQATCRAAPCRRLSPDSAQRCRRIPHSAGNGPEISNEHFRWDLHGCTQNADECKKHPLNHFNRLRGASGGPRSARGVCPAVFEALDELRATSTFTEDRGKKRVNRWSTLPLVQRHPAELEDRASHLYPTKLPLPERKLRRRRTRSTGLCAVASAVQCRFLNDSFRTPISAHRTPNLDVLSGNNASTG